MPPVTRQSARIAALAVAPNHHKDHGHHDRRPINISYEPAKYIAPSNVKVVPKAQSYDTPPIYTIDLSLPPAQRYVEIAHDFKDNLLDLIHLFDEVVESLNLTISLGTVKRLARLFLRRVHSNEQTEELRGISTAIGVEMYLLVAFNTLLDLFMGCTSGGVKVGDHDKRKMLHFRTLDWGMDVLRSVVVQYEFVEKPHGKVIARSVGYVGFVGILTGVRQNLSLSLNFRGHHNDSDSKWVNFKYYGNHLAVLLGFRPSISSRLREYILPKCGKPVLNVLDIRSELPSTVTTACYIIACDGDSTTVFEKDLASAQIYNCTRFITATNHDCGCEFDKSHPYHHSKTQELTDMGDVIAESIDRKESVKEKWRKTVQRYQRRNRWSVEDDVYTDLEEVKTWMVSYPIANECTHYAVIMDPKEGQVAWCRRWKERLEGPGNSKFDRTNVG